MAYDEEIHQGVILPQPELRELLDQLVKGSLQQTITKANGDKTIIGSMETQSMELHAGAFDFRLGVFNTQQPGRSALETTQLNRLTLLCELTADRQTYYLSTQDKDEFYNKIVELAADKPLFLLKSTNDPLLTKAITEKQDDQNVDPKHQHINLQDKAGNSYRFTKDYANSPWPNHLAQSRPLEPYDIARFQIPNYTRSVSTAKEFLATVVKVSGQDALVMPISAKDHEVKQAADILLTTKDHPFFQQNQILKGDRLMNIPVSWLMTNQNQMNIVGKLHPEIRKQLTKATLSKLKLWSFVHGIADEVAKQREAKQNRDQKQDHKHKTLSR